MVVLRKQVMDSKKSGENDAQEKENYERESYLLALRQWNISYPINAGLLIFGALAAAAVLLQSIYVGQTLTETRSDFKAAQRAYVNFGSKTGVLAEFDPKATIDGKPVIILHFTNGGLSTARHLAIEASTGNTFRFTYRHRYRGSRGDILTEGARAEEDLAAQGERADYIFDAQSLSSLDKSNPPKQGFAIHGELAYCDIFGVYHCEPFATEYVPEIGKFVPFGGFNNCYVERGNEQSWDLGGGQRISYKEIEQCEQPDEPEYYGRVDVAASITTHGDVGASVVVIPPKPTPTPTPTPTK
jgi:hypothetical protein